MTHTISTEKVKPQPLPNKGKPSTWRARLRAAREIYEGLFFAPYRSALYREQIRQRDMFLLLGFSELLGTPNPVTFYTLELYPRLLEEFHGWHQRMGMEHCPDGGFRCC